MLFEVEGLSYEEISAIEAVPIGTIRSRLSRARQELRELLSETTPASGVRGEGLAEARAFGRSQH